jgi:hypothetical protein
MSRKYVVRNGCDCTPCSRVLSICAAQTFSRTVILGFGARYYTDQPGDLLDTFSIPAYGLVDASIFYRRRHLGLAGEIPIIWPKNAISPAPAVMCTCNEARGQFTQPSTGG